jgi:hypothetical protein
MARQKTQPALLAPQCHAPPTAVRSACLPPGVPIHYLRTQPMNVHLALQFRNTPGCGDIPPGQPEGFP